MRHLRTPRWARNPRRAYDKAGIEIAPVTIGDLVRQNGIHHVRVWCVWPGCGRYAVICIDDWPPETFVPDIGLRLRCSACGTRRAAQVQPDWKEWRSQG